MTTRKEVEQYLELNHKDDDVAAQLDEIIFGGDYIDDDWEEDGEYENKYDWYVDHGNKEAEGDVVDSLCKEINAHFGVYYLADLDLVDIIRDKYDIL